MHVGVECSSPESGKNSGSLKVSQVRRLQRRSIDLRAQVRYGYLGNARATEGSRCTHVPSVVHCCVDMHGTRPGTMGKDSRLALCSDLNRRPRVVAKNFATISDQHLEVLMGSREHGQPSAPTGFKLMSANHASALKEWKLQDGDEPSSLMGSKLQMVD